MQVLLASYDDWDDMGQILDEINKDLGKMLRAKVLSQKDTSKEALIERRMRESFSLIYFLVHGSAEGKARR